ncbi:MAG: hypothetical protein HZB66_01375 [Candidatus Aenigmarchaeota archaeon]|nr:hypothetical protein [Candidatus Aenigmarchaeota archaeon]
MLKNPKILFWLAVLVIAIILIGPNFNPEGFKVVYSNQTGLRSGDVIYKINDAKATEELLKKDYADVVKIETSRGVVFAKPNGTLGMAYEKVSSTNLNFGLDLKGGTRAIIKPVNFTENGTLEQIMSTLQTRINVYGLREASFRPLWYEGQGFVEITMAGGSGSELRSLLERQGKFEAKIPMLVDTLKLDKDYPIEIINNNTVKIAGKNYQTGESIEISGVVVKLENVMNGKANLTATVFTGKDIEIVYFDPQRSRVERAGDGFRWSFAVQISNAGAQRFGWITNNLDKSFDPSAGETYLSSKIYLYLDDKLIDSLNIGASLKGKPETNPSITGGSSTYESALKTKQYLQSILRSGSLPTEIQIIQMDTVSPKLGSNFLQNVAYAGLAAVFALTLVIIIRYRKIKIIVPMVAVSLSEIIIILGLSVVIGWTIDLAAIAGVIAAVGTGVDDQLVILDQMTKKRKQELTVKERIQHAFFIVFGAAGTVIAAMLPLLTIGFGLLRGFAITTMIGIFVGIFITRPAFALIAEKISETGD